VKKLSFCLFCLMLISGASLTARGDDNDAIRNPKQPVDEEYTKKIREYTTQPYFNSPLADYLPASKTVPTPKAVLGDIAGAPGILPYSKQVWATSPALPEFCLTRSRSTSTCACWKRPVRG